MPNIPTTRRLSRRGRCSGGRRPVSVRRLLDDHEGAQMSVTVRIPTPLRKLTKEADVVSGDGGTLASCIEPLERQYPGLKERLCDEGGELRRVVNVYVNGEDIRFLDGMATALKAGDGVSIVPAVAGG